jgi:hypothetical protein
MAGGVEEQHGDLDGGDAVDQRVMRLANDGPAPAAQAAHEVDPPQRVACIERLGEQRPGQLA